jgi:uncharacterized protein (DUF1778 family)
MAARVTGLWLSLVVIGAAVGAADDRVAGSATERFRAIEFNYDRDLAALDAQARPQQKLALAQRRDALFNRLLDDFQPTDAAALSTADLVALAKGGEYVGRHEAALNYARLALARAPDETSAYPPFIRTLLNVNRTDEAAGLLAEAWEKFDHSADVHELNGFVYAKYKSQGSLEQAARHMERLFDYYAAAIEQSPVMAQWATSHLGSLVDAQLVTGQDERLARSLQRYRELVQRKLASPVKRQSASSGMDEREFAGRCALLNFDCELAQFLDPTFAGSAQARWLGETVAAALQQPRNGTILGQLGDMLVYAAEHSYVWDEAFLAAVGKAAESAAAIQSNDDDLREARARIHQELVDFEQSVQHQVSLAKAVVGRSVETADGLDWLAEKPDVGTPVLLHFWNPFRSPGLAGVQQFKTLRAKYPATDLAIAAIAPYTGLTWDAARLKASRSPGVDATSEREALQQVLRVAQIDTPCALARDNAKIAEWFIRDDNSVTVVVDRDGKVRWLSIGLSPAALSYLEHRLYQLVTIPANRP